MRGISPGTTGRALGWLSLVLLAVPVAAQRPRPPRAPVIHRPAAVGVAASALQGVWEAVNYPEDLTLQEVYFITPDEGWVTGTGTGGVLLHTADGGAHWEVQLGDAAGTERPFESLQFVDRSTGFVVQRTAAGDHSLLRTLDGLTWRVTGTAPQHRTALRFISATVGVTAGHNQILRTEDAGRTWTPVFDCTLPVSSRGLTRTSRCEIGDFSFPTPDLGFAVAGSFDVRGLYLLRTEDAGRTWTGALALADDGQAGIDGREAHLVFTDAQHGYTCLNGGKLFGTDDGGATWEAVPGAGCENLAPIAFADPEVGWAFRYRRMTYTTDGGRRWMSREIPLPASGHGFSLPRRDWAYVVGDHGMVYRYHVVPANAAPPGSLTAPAMPGVPTLLGVQVDSLGEEVGQLAADATAPTGVGRQPADGQAGQAPMTPFIAACCGKRLSRVGLILEAVGALAPEFTTKYRNLNLLAQGLRVATALPEDVASLQSAIRAFQTAPDQPAADAALATVRSVLDGLRAQVDTALQRPSATADTVRGSR